MYIRPFILLFFFFVTLSSAQETKLIAFYTKNIAKVSNKDVQIAIRKILQTGSQKSGINLQEEFPKSISNIIDSFINGKYALITLNTYDVLQNYEKISPYIGKIWSIAKKKRSPEMRYLLLVKKRDPIESSVLHRGARVAMLNFDYMQNIYLESYLLENYHQSSKEFFKKLSFYSSSSQVILKLFFSKVDACVISEHAYNIAVELNPQLKKHIKILASSKKIFPSVGLTISRKGDREIAKLYDTFSRDKNDIKTLSNVLMLYKAEAIVPFSQEKMDRLYAFYKHYHALKAEHEQ